MQRLALVLALALLATGVTTASQARADQKVTIDQVPAKVRETIRQHVQDGRIEEIDREQRASGVVYEVEYTAADGIEYEMDVAEDGRLLAKKRE
jgi:ABC-type sugar transport system substrate-binding protein